jgi:hypothetical protein
VIPGFAEFEFDLPNALLESLVTAFEKISSVPLTLPNVAMIPDEQGVYQLFLKRGGARRLVYIGKTDGDAGLNKRLARHAAKIQSRENLDPADVFFKAARIFVFTAVDLETQLIRHYSKSEDISWNGSGFGSNDPGRERDTTTYKADHFDTQFPIDIQRPLNFDLPHEASVATILRVLKRKLPYLIRFQTQLPTRLQARGATRLQTQRTKIGRAHPELETTMINLLPAFSGTVYDVLMQLIQALPPGWHATKLPSHVIIYKNDTRNFPSGTLIARSSK